MDQNCPNLKINVKSPTKLFYDNKTTISITHNSIQHDHTKQVKIDRHFVKEKLDFGLTICTLYMASINQSVKTLTKGLVGSSFYQILGKLGMHNILIPT